MRHVEATGNYGKVEANINGSGDVLFCFCRGTGAESRPEAATAEVAPAEGRTGEEQESATAEGKRRR